MDEKVIPSTYSVGFLGLLFFLNVFSIYLIYYKLTYNEMPNNLTRLTGAIYVVFSMMFIYLLSKSNRSRKLMKDWERDKKSWRIRGYLVFSYIISTVIFLFFSIHFSSKWW